MVFGTMSMVIKIWFQLCFFYIRKMNLFISFHNNVPKNRAQAVKSGRHAFEFLIHQHSHLHSGDIFKLWVQSPFSVTSCDTVSPQNWITQMDTHLNHRYFFTCYVILQMILFKRVFLLFCTPEFWLWSPENTKL